MWLERKEEKRNRIFNALLHCNRCYLIEIAFTFFFLNFCSEVRQNKYHNRWLINIEFFFLRPRNVRKQTVNKSGYVQGDSPRYSRKIFHLIYIKCDILERTFKFHYSVWIVKTSRFFYKYVKGASNSRGNNISVKITYN